MQNLTALLTILALSALCVIADSLFKQASELAQPFRSSNFIAGMGLYAVSAFGWVYVLRYTKLATVGALYSVIVVVLLAIVGVAVFHEPLSLTEIIGLVCAAIALLLLGRFS